MHFLVFGVSLLWHWTNNFNPYDNKLDEFVDIDRYLIGSISLYRLKRDAVEFTEYSSIRTGWYLNDDIFKFNIMFSVL